MDTLENLYSPMQCFEQFYETAQSLLIEGTLLHHLLKKYTVEEVKELLPSVINQVIESPNLIERDELKKEVEHCLKKVSSQCLNQIPKELEDLRRLKMDIDKELKKRQKINQELKKNDLLKCSKCEKSFPTHHGLHYHQTQTHGQPNKDENERNPAKTKRLRKSGRRSTENGKKEDIYEDE